MMHPKLEPWEPVYTDPHTGVEITEYEFQGERYGPVPDVPALPHKCPTCSADVRFPGESCYACREATP